MENNWNESIETLLETYGNEAQVRSMLHHDCHHYYKYWSLRIQVPVIALSTISGGGNFISASFDKYKDMLIMIIGGISLFIAVISSIYKYLEFDKNVEGHRVAHSAWNKLYNDIIGQLLIDRKNRVNSIEFMKSIKLKRDRLNEISPIVKRDFYIEIKKKIEKESPDFKFPYYIDNLKNVVSTQILNIENNTDNTDNNRVIEISTELGNEPIEH